MVQPPENENTLAKTDPGVLAEAQGDDLPAWLQDEEEVGKEEIKRNMTPPRLILIQRQAKSDLLDRFNPGDVVLMPNGIVLGNCLDGSLEVPLPVTPVFHYVEYVVENPKKFWATEGKIRERTFDHESTIAKKALNWSLRNEPHPVDAEQVITHGQRLNYVFYVHHPEFQGSAIYTFKRSMVRAGQDFNALINARKGPLYAGIYWLDVGIKEKDGDEWFASSVVNPPVGAERWVSKELVEKLKEEHRITQEHFTNRTFDPNSLVDEDEDAEAAVAEQNAAASDEF